MIIKEIICVIISFITIYLIILLDNQLNKKCDCVDNGVSVKVPFILTILFYIIFKLLETYIYEYICGFSIIKQDIITEMADF